MERVLIMLCAVGYVAAAAANERTLGSPNPVQLELVDDHGRVLSTYPVAAERPDTVRAYVEAEPRGRYSIRVRNRSADRVGIVIAVDGRNIISGKRSDLDHSESMYVLDAHQSATYSGWRTSAEEVHRFYFTNSQDSYASRIGDESAIGVVAAAVYKAERRPARSWRQRSAEIQPAPAGEAPEAADARAQRDSRAGTGFGERERSRAVRVAFTPARRPSQRAFFKYEWAEQLCARGVKPCGPANRFWPQRWQGFVPFPPG